MNYAANKLECTRKTKYPGFNSQYMKKEIIFNEKDHQFIVTGRDFNKLP